MPTSPRERSAMNNVIKVDFRPAKKQKVRRIEVVIGYRFKSSLTLAFIPVSIYALSVWMVSL